MAKLHFFYSTMNAGKSTSMLQTNHNYIETGLETMIFIPKETESSSNSKVVSRIGFEAHAISANKNLNFLKYIKKHKTSKLSCILIDEAQFLSKDQVRQLCEVADKFNLPVLCYGIRTDFRGELFEGSSTLLALADNLIELKTICSLCARKATMVVRLDSKGNALKKGSQIKIGGNDIYKVVCRKHFRKLTGLI
jgi:thymidine kinase